MTCEIKKSEAVQSAEEFSDLIHLTEVDKDALLDYEQRLGRLKPETIGSYQALDRFYVHSYDRGSKLESQMDDLEEQATVIYQTHNTTLIYLTIKQLGLQNGWTEEQANEVFRLQLEFNHELTPVQRKFDRIGISHFKGESDRASAAAFEKLAARKPFWFKAKHGNWTNLLRDSTPLLNEIRATLQKSVGAHTQWIGKLGVAAIYTDPDLLPDWADSQDTPFPDVEVVKCDFIEDENQNQKIVEQYKYAYAQRKYLADSNNVKGRKTIARNTAKYRQFFPPNKSSVCELLVFLANTDGLKYYNLDPSMIDAMSPDDINATEVNGEAKEQLVIRAFSEHSDQSPEMVRIFLRKKLGEAGIFNADFAKRNKYIAALLNSTLDKGEAAALKSEDKKAFKAMTFEVKPILSGLDEESLELLRIELSDNPFLTETELVNRLSEFVIDSNWGESGDKNAQKLAEKYKNFVINWLRNHWREAYESLELKLSENVDFVDRSAKFEAEDKIQKSYKSEFDESIKELDDSITELRMGNLVDWSVHFDVNKNGDSRMELLEGDSLEALEDRLQALLIKHKISCSIKLSSVINTLEWAAALPQDVLQLMIRENIDGRDYLKIKRGNVRLFFQIDREVKKLVFFVYQKQALSYRF